MQFQIIRTLLYYHKIIKNKIGEYKEMKQFYWRYVLPKPGCGAAVPNAAPAPVPNTGAVCPKTVAGCVAPNIEVFWPNAGVPNAFEAGLPNAVCCCCCPNGLAVPNCFDPNILPKEQKKQIKINRKKFMILKYAILTTLW